MSQMSVKSGTVQHTSITFCDPENMRVRVVFGNPQISYLLFFYLILFEVITASGFGRDCDTILVIWRRYVPYVVIFVFVESLDT